jgi:hypothetical protein
MPVCFGGETTKEEFLLLGIALLATLALSILASAYAETAGVQVGNHFEYKINNISGTGMDGTDNFTVDVSDVSSNGSIIYLQQTAGYPNGTQHSWSIGYMNIETGPPGCYETIWWSIGANLKAGDSVWPESGMSILINGTESVGGRPTNYVIMNNVDINGQYVTTYMYWDQATGVPVNVSVSSTSFSFSYVLTSTNVWAVPEFSPMAFVLFAFTLTAAAVAIASKKRGCARK